MYIEKLITKLKTPWLNAGCIRGQMPYSLTEKKWSQLIFYNPRKKNWLFKTSRKWNQILTVNIHIVCYLDN